MKCAAAVLLVLAALLAFTAAAPAPRPDDGDQHHQVASWFEALVSRLSAAKPPQEATTAAATANKEYIVVFKRGTNETAQEAVKSYIKDTLLPASAVENGEVWKSVDFRTWAAFKLVAPESVAEQVRALDDVDWVQTNNRFKMSTTVANAPIALARLSATNSAALFQAKSLEYSFPASAGGNVDVYIVDSGIKPDHPEFEGRATLGLSTLGEGTTAVDENGHGTHVAGIIASKTFGVAKDANVIAVRVLNANGEGDSQQLIDGLSYAIAAAMSSDNPAVINLSLGGEADNVVDQAVQTALNNGVPIVVAAGNDAVDACTQSPGRVPGALTVAAIDPIDDTFASFSNFGSCVDLSAPGVSVQSTWIGGNVGVIGNDGDSNVLDGTSMAAPHVTGIIALMLANNRTLKPDVIAQRVLNAATNTALAPEGTTTKNAFNGGAAGI